MAHHARYPRLVSAALPEALRRAIYDRHAKRIAARLRTAPGSFTWVTEIYSLVRADPDLFPLYHNGIRRFPTAR